MVTFLRVSFFFLFLLIYSVMGMHFLNWNQEGAFLTSSTWLSFFKILSFFFISSFLSLLTAFALIPRKKSKVLKDKKNKDDKRNEKTGEEKEITPEIVVDEEPDSPGENPSQESLIEILTDGKEKVKKIHTSPKGKSTHKKSGKNPSSNPAKKKTTVRAKTR